MRKDVTPVSRTVRASARLGAPLVVSALIAGRRARRLRRRADHPDRATRSPPSRAPTRARATSRSATPTIEFDDARPMAPRSTPQAADAPLEMTIVNSGYRGRPAGLREQPGRRVGADHRRSRGSRAGRLLAIEGAPAPRRGRRVPADAGEPPGRACPPARPTPADHAAHARSPSRAAGPEAEPGREARSCSPGCARTIQAGLHLPGRPDLRAGRRGHASTCRSANSDEPREDAAH